MKRKRNSDTNNARTRIHRALTDAEGWVSGEDLAGMLGISRAAVGKHMAWLRRGGNYIESSPRRGFRLLVAAEQIDPAAVARHLSTKYLGRGQWLCLDEADSTNTEAAALALEGAKAGTVVTAETQTRGKGRKGHAWFSSPRGLQFSVILPPDTERAGTKAGAPEQDATRSLTEKAQRALIRALKELAPVNPLPKPPNDILVDGRKIAGILVEMGLRGGDVDWLVLGIGCNVNTVQEEFPPELAEQTTSVFAAGGNVHSKNRVLAEFLNWFERGLGDKS